MATTQPKSQWIILWKSTNWFYSSFEKAQDTKSCCCPVAKSCLILWDLINCSTPGFPVLHYLPQFAQTHVHQVNDAIQPSHPVLPRPSPPASKLFQNQGRFQWVSSLYQVAKILELQFQRQFFQWIFRADSQDWLVWSLCYPRYFKNISMPQFKSINSLAPSLHYGPTLTSIHDC